MNIGLLKQPDDRGHEGFYSMLPLSTTTATSIAAVVSTTAASATIVSDAIVSTIASDGTIGPSILVVSSLQAKKLKTRAVPRAKNKLFMGSPFG